jgi:hypothetical protein
MGCCTLVEALITRGSPAKKIVTPAINRAKIVVAHGSSLAFPDITFSF